MSKSGILRKGEPSRASSGPGVPIAQKLTASALQQLEPSTHSIALPAFKPREGLDGPTNPMGGQGYWGQVCRVGLRVARRWLLSLITKKLSLALRLQSAEVQRASGFYQVSASGTHSDFVNTAQCAVF